METGQKFKIVRKREGDYIVIYLIGDNGDRKQIAVIGPLESLKDYENYYCKLDFIKENFDLINEEVKRRHGNKTDI